MVSAVANVIGGGAFAQTSPPVKAGQTVSFVDDFVRVAGNRWDTSHNWRGGVQDCAWSRNNVRVVEQKLNLSIAISPANIISCAELKTRPLYGFGTYEFRLRPISASGVLTAAFLYARAGNVGGGHQQISIEFAGKDTRTMLAVHFYDGKQIHSEAIPLDFDASSKSNDYAIQWLPNAIRWYAGGRLVSEFKPPPSQVGMPEIPSQIALSVWNGRPWTLDWLGPLQLPDGAASAVVEQVAFTQQGVRCQFPSSIVCKLGLADNAARQ